MILRAMREDPKVQYVRLYWRQNCANDLFLYRHVCDPEVTLYGGMFVNTPWYSDRPHFATTSFYEDNVFPRILENDTNTPEEIVEQGLCSLETMWLYGMPGHMLHEVNHLTSAYNMQDRAWTR